jgi:hypothetical protein
MKSYKLILVLVGYAVLLTGSAVSVVRADDNAPPKNVRLVGPDVMQPGTRHLVHVEGIFDGNAWKHVGPDQFTVRVTGSGRLADDPAAKQMNPLEIICDSVDFGKVTVEVRAGDKSSTRTFNLGTPKPAGTFDAAVSPASVTHRFMGLGGGVLFYDNQFDITTDNQIYDWCFKDIRTSILHVLIRPDYEKDATGDWKTVDLDKFDFKALERPMRIIKKALERNPDLKIYASIYTPPAWMKANNSTAGKAALKDGPRFRQELAKYVFAYLKYAARQGVTVHYLGLFNEPDFAHTQDGMYFPDLGILADTFLETTKALETLIAADTEFKKTPIYVFPDTLGAGAITRGGKNSQKLREYAKALDKVGVWGVHDYWNQSGPYWGQRFKELRTFPGVGSKPIWMTEWAQRERHGDLDSGVEFGSEMLNALRLGAEAWMVFEWCHPSGNQSGLISTDWGAKTPRERFWRSKAYHVFRQIANTTPAGAQVVTMTAKWKGTAQGSGIEYLAARDGENIIVHLMNTEPLPVTYHVSLARKADNVEGWLTSPLDNMAAAGTMEMTVSKQGESTTVGGAIPANSLLTFVHKGSKAP